MRDRYAPNIEKLRTVATKDAMPEDFRRALVEAALRADRSYRLELREAVITDRYVPSASEVLESLKQDPGFAALETVWRLSSGPADHLFNAIHARCVYLEKKQFEELCAIEVKIEDDDPTGALGA